MRRQESVSEVGGCSNSATSLCQPDSSLLDSWSNAAASLYHPGLLSGTIREGQDLRTGRIALKATIVLWRYARSAQIRSGYPPEAAQR